MKQQLGQHRSFRQWCGSDQKEVDLSWQGQFSDAEISAIQFLKVAVYGKVLDPHYKTILKGGTNIEDVMMSQKIADIISEIMLKLEAEINPGKVKEATLLLEDDEDDAETWNTWWTLSCWRMRRVPKSFKSISGP